MAEMDAGRPGDGEGSYEHSDLPMRSVVIFGVVLMVGTAALMGGLVGLYWLMDHWEDRIKEDNLPVASLDKKRELPHPVMEGIAEVKDRKFQFWPPRGAEFRAQEEETLNRPSKRVVPIQEAMRDVAGLLPVRSEKGIDTRPPVSHQRRLPSRASSGRVSTGGQ